MKKIGVLILILPLMASANLPSLFSSFGFEPSPSGENRVQVTGWDKKSASPGSSYGVYTRNSVGAAAQAHATDGMSIYTWDTASETSLALKTVIITTAFMAEKESAKNQREVYIYDYTKLPKNPDDGISIEAVTYCNPNFKACSSVNSTSCAQGTASAKLAAYHSQLLSSHYIGVGAAMPAGMTEKIKALNIDLTKSLCSQFFKNAKVVSKSVSKTDSKKSGKN